MAVANALAFYNMETITAVKNFMAQVPEEALAELLKPLH
jgi:hypothetical protein